MRTRTTLALAVPAALATLAATHAATRTVQPADADHTTPLIVLTGHDAGADEPVWTIARSQEVLNESWALIMGDAGPRAAQGWHMVPAVDFERCEALLIAAGPTTNSNGYRVLDVLETHNALTIRVESISFQTASFEGPDRGVPANPWALILIPATEKTIFLEENTQNLIGAEPIWQRRSAFPGVIGVGAPVPGTRQTGDR